MFDDKGVKLCLINIGICAVQTYHFLRLGIATEYATLSLFRRDISEQKSGVHFCSSQRHAVLVLRNNFKAQARRVLVGLAKNVRSHTAQTIIGRNVNRKPKSIGMRKLTESFFIG